MTENNAKQADFPEGAEILPNPLGTAPGFALTVFDSKDSSRTTTPERSLLFFLPGVPRELARMMDEEVVPRIVTRAGRAERRPGTVRAALLRTFGIGESALDTLLTDLVRDDPAAHLGFRTQFPDNLIRIVARDPDARAAQGRLEEILAQVRERLGPLVVSEGPAELSEVVGGLLLERGLTLAVAESCTGGLLSSHLTDVPGSSRYLLASWVAYSNEAKVCELGVSAADLEHHGAVSEKIACQLAEGARRRVGADIGVATTGVAGPGGGTPEKPVGTVWVALADSAGTVAHAYALMRERARNKELAAHIALDWIRRRILGFSLTESTFPRLRGDGP